MGGPLGICRTCFDLTSERHPSLARPSPSTHLLPLDRSLHLRFVASECACHGRWKDAPHPNWEAPSSFTMPCPTCDSYSGLAVPPYASPWSGHTERDAHPPLSRGAVASAKAEGGSKMNLEEELIVEVRDGSAFGRA